MVLSRGAVALGVVLLSQLSRCLGTPIWPIDNNDPVDSVGKDDRNGRQILLGETDIIKGDGPYKHESIPRLDIGGTWDGNATSMRLFFAQLVGIVKVPKGQERDEAIFVTGDGERRRMWYEMNYGDGTFDGWKHDLDVGRDCYTKDMHWGDVDGDGLDDFICLAADGEMFVSINQGTNPATFKSIGSYKTPERGLPRYNVRLGDIDGDGRLDYCAIEGNGDIYCWRNGGLGQKAEFWQDMGLGKPVFTDNTGDIQGGRFVDINGDGRHDWIWMDERGTTTTWINQRGDDMSLIPKWLEAGETHRGVDRQAGMIEDDNADRHRIQFGRIFADEKTDYVYYVIKKGGDSEGAYVENEAEWSVWQSKGFRGRYLAW